MKILFIYDGDYPWDIRVEKVCNSLNRGGHEVHMVCRNIARKQRDSAYKSITLHRLPFLPRFLGDINKAFTFPAFFSPVWLWCIYKQAKANNCKLIIVRDLPMALAGLWIAKLMKMPCILDMAECYPEMIRCTWQFEGRSLKNVFLRNPVFADWIEKLVLRNISQVWVMIEESRDRLIDMRVPEGKIRLISNTPEIDRFNKKNNSLDVKRSTDCVYSMIYVGLLNPSRGLDTVLDGVSRYIKINPTFKFTIVGKGKAEGDLRRQIHKLGLTRNVEMLGWIENKMVPFLIAQADIGIVPHHKCSHWDNTIPNKLFDYMASRRPVIVSDVAPMKRIVNSSKCGLVYQDYNDADLCRVIAELSISSFREQLAQNGYDAIISKYNWEREENALLESVKRLQ
jgi:glycosyltransferase involved in cell wall biosynthesis